jgi:hypothetical protein
LILLVFGIKSFLFPFPIIDEPSFLFATVDSFLVSSPIVKLILGLFVISVLAVFINKVFNSNGFYQNESTFPSLLFVVLAGSWTGFHFFSPLFFSLFFILLGLNRVLKVYHQKSILSEVFDAGFYLGLGAIFYYPVGLLLISFWFYISMNRAFSLREYFFPLFGFSIPFFFLSVFYFYYDLPFDFLDIIPEPSVASLINLGSLTQRVFLILTVLIFLLSIIFFIKQIAHSKIKDKNSRWLMIILFLNSTLIYVLSFTFYPIHNRELLLFIPMVFIMPFYFYGVGPLYRNLLFYFWIIAAILFDYIPSI